MTRVLAIACALLVGAIHAAHAQQPDYPPRRCSVALPYVGPALRTPLIAPAFATRKVETGALDQDRVTRLDAAFSRALTATGAPSATAALIIPGSGVWRATYPAPPASGAPLHYWASAGKTFTAVAILQLAEEGKLSLADPVSKWIEGVPNGNAITIENLLNHTSGLFSANEDLVVQREGRRLGLEDELRIARRHGAMFCPGENWRYSNTGYTLLGAILERVEQRPYAQIITDRIIQHLGPVRLRVVTPDDRLTDVAAPVAGQGVRAIDPRVPGAAGAIVGDADGMIAFWRALLGGELLSQDLTRAMFARLYPMFGGPESYGLGVTAYELPAQAGGPPPELWVGHSGGAPGVKAVAAYSLTDRAFVAVAVTGDGSAGAFANLLLDQIRAPTR